MDNITRRQALGGMAVAMAGLLAGRAALGAEAASSQAGDTALDATVNMGDLTVAYPSAWT